MSALVRIAILNRTSSRVRKVPTTVPNPEVPTSLDDLVGAARQQKRHRPGRSSRVPRLLHRFRAVYSATRSARHFVGITRRRSQRAQIGCRDARHRNPMSNRI